ncbi:MAG: HU family DNA-binding protein [Lysobacterales bacterium]
MRLPAARATLIAKTTTNPTAHPKPSRRHAKGVPMKKNELVAAIAEAAELSKADAGRALDAFVDCVTNSLKAGDSVTLVGFGTFEVRARAARQGRNPRTGKTLDIKASKVPAFKAGKALKDAVN